MPHSALGVRFSVPKSMSERLSHQWLPALLALVTAVLFGSATTADSPELLYKNRPISQWIDALQSKDVAQRRNAAESLTLYDPNAHAIVPRFSRPSRMVTPAFAALQARRSAL